MKNGTWRTRALSWLGIVLLGCAATAVGLAETDAAVRLSEACSSNKTVYTLEDGSTPDWIELYNGGQETAALDGLYLSNDEERPLLFSLDGLTIEPQGYLVLHADKKQLPFKLSASGGETLTLCNAEGTVLDSVEMPPLNKDAAYARQMNGEWHVTSATPGRENSAGEPYRKRVYVARPVLSHAPGFYDEPILLDMSAGAGCEIYYTLDGSVPTKDSLRFDGAIELRDATEKENRLSMIREITIETYNPPEVLIPKGHVVRAIAVDADGNESAVVTASYFIHFQDREAFQKIGVMSITVRESDLFDKHTGIMMLGDTYDKFIKEFGKDAIGHKKEYANYQLRGRTTEKEVHVEYFESDHKEVLSQDVGLRIHGNYSRVHAEKSFTLFARSEYSFGTDVVDYAFFGGKEKESKVVLRSLKSFGRDVLAHRLLNGTGIPTISDAACMLFINGEFWGYYDIRPGMNARTMGHQFDLDSDDVIIYKNGVLEDGEETTERTLKGDYETFSNMDLSVPENYQAVQDVFDIESYITHLAGNLYTANTDGFSYNVTAWRTGHTTSNPDQDGKWRYIFQDLDITSGAGHDSITAADACERMKTTPMFTALWQNETFQAQFLTRVMDLGNLFFTEERVEEVLRQVYDAREEYYAETRQRYGHNRTATNVKNARESIRAFYANRMETLQAELKKSQGVNRALHTVTLTGLENLNLLNGGLLVNGYPLEARERWSGKYFEGCTVVLTACGLAEGDFLGWYDAETGRLSEEPVLTLSMEHSHTVYPRVRLPEEEVAENAGTTSEQGLTLELDTAYASAMELALEWETADSSARWRSEYSLDGESWKPFGFALRSNAECGWWYLPLPAETLDRDWMAVRIVCEVPDGGATLALKELRISRARGEVTLSRFRAIRQAIEALGLERDFPDEAQLLRMPQEEIDRTAETLRQEAIGAYIGALATTAEAFPDASFIAYGAAPVLCVDEALRGLTDRFAWPVPDGYGEVWLYAWENGGLTLRGQASGATSMEIQTDGDVWLMLPMEAEKYPSVLSFSTEWRDEALLKETFHDRMPGFSLWLDLREPIPAGRRTAVRFNGQAEQNRLYLYRYDHGQLRLPRSKESWTDGVMYVEDGLEAGAYLLLDHSMEMYQELYEAEVSRTLSLLYLAAGAGACIVGLVWLIILRSRRRRAAFKKPAAPPPRRRRG